MYAYHFQHFTRKKTMETNNIFLFNKIKDFIIKKGNRFTKNEGQTTFYATQDIVLIANEDCSHQIDDDLQPISYSETTIIYTLQTFEGVIFRQKTIRNYGLQVGYNSMVVEDYVTDEVLSDYRLQSLFDFLTD